MGYQNSNWERSLLTPLCVRCRAEACVAAGMLACLEPGANCSMLHAREHATLSVRSRAEARVAAVRIPKRIPPSTPAPPMCICMW